MPQGGDGAQRPDGRLSFSPLGSPGTTSESTVRSPAGLTKVVPSPTKAGSVVRMLRSLSMPCTTAGELVARDDDLHRFRRDAGKLGLEDLEAPARLHGGGQGLDPRRTQIDREVQRGEQHEESPGQQ